MLTCTVYMIFISTNHLHSFIFSPHASAFASAWWWFLVPSLTKKAKSYSHSCYVVASTQCMDPTIASVSCQHQQFQTSLSVHNCQTYLKWNMCWTKLGAGGVLVQGPWARWASILLSCFFQALQYQVLIKFKPASRQQSHTKIINTMYTVYLKWTEIKQTKWSLGQVQQQQQQQPLPSRSLLVSQLRLMSPVSLVSLVSPPSETTRRSRHPPTGHVARGSIQRV